MYLSSGERKGDTDFINTMKVALSSRVNIGKQRNLRSKKHRSDSEQYRKGIARWVQRSP